MLSVEITTKTNNKTATAADGSTIEKKWMQQTAAAATATATTPTAKQRHLSQINIFWNFFQTCVDTFGKIAYNFQCRVLKRSTARNYNKVRVWESWRKTPVDSSKMERLSQQCTDPASSHCGLDSDWWSPRSAGVSPSWGQWRCRWKRRRRLWRLWLWWRW